MRPDRTLRQTVAKLAGATPDDIEAVLGGLDSRQRRAIETLLAEYRGVAGSPALALVPETAQARPPQLAGLSPWLRVRLERRVQSGASRPGSLTEMSSTEVREAGMTFAMTSTAFEALQSVAADLEQNLAPAIEPASSRLWKARRAPASQRAGP